MKGREYGDRGRRRLKGRRHEMNGQKQRYRYIEKEKGEMSRKMREKREEERYGEEERAGVAGHGHSLSLTTAAFICGGNTARRE